MSDQLGFVRYPLPASWDEREDQIPIFRLAPKASALPAEVAEAHALYRKKLADYYAPRPEDQTPAPTLAEVNEAYDCYRRRLAEWTGEDAA